MNNLQPPIERKRPATAQELAELRKMVELETLSDDFISPEIEALVRSLRFEDARIMIVENAELTENGRRGDAALLVWPEAQWYMVFVRQDKPIIPSIRWHVMINCDRATFEREVMR